METSIQLPSIVCQWCAKEEKEKETLYESSGCFCVQKTTEEKLQKLTIKHTCKLKKVQKLDNNKLERKPDVREEHRKKEMKRKNTFTVSGACMLESGYAGFYLK